MIQSATTRAMKREGAEKTTIRKEWVSIVKSAEKLAKEKTRPLYVTLSGAEGKDIEALIDAGVIKRAENGKSISQEDLWKVVAIESNPIAEAQLRGKFPGLKTKRANVDDLISGLSDTTFPRRNDERYEFWTASVINLDYNKPLKAHKVGSKLAFGVSQILGKISAIQQAEESDSWHILLTLHASLNLNEDSWGKIVGILTDNFSKNDKFKEQFLKLNPIIDGENISDKKIAAIKKDESLQQKFLMAIIPKLIAQRLRADRWEVTNSKAFIYGEGKPTPQARMASWIISLKKPREGLSKGDCYKNNLEIILESCYRIGSNGKATALVE